MNEGQGEQLLTIFDGISKTLESILAELKRHNDNAKDRSDGIEEAVREVSQAVADGFKDVSNAMDGMNRREG